VKKYLKGETEYQKTARAPRDSRGPSKKVREEIGTVSGAHRKQGVKKTLSLKSCELGTKERGIQEESVKRSGDGPEGNRANGERSQSQGVRQTKNFLRDM